MTLPGGDRPLALSTTTLLIGTVVGLGAGLAFAEDVGVWLVGGLLAVILVVLTGTRPELAVSTLILVLPLKGDVALVSASGLPDITVGRLLMLWSLMVVGAGIRRQRSQSDTVSDPRAGQDLMRGPLPIWVGVFLALMLLAALRSASLVTGTQAWLDSYLLPFGALLIVTRYRWSSREVNVVVSSYLVGCILWSLLALVESLIGRSLFTADGALPWASGSSILLRTGGPFINPAVLGAAVGIGLVLAWVWASQSGLSRHIALACVPIAMIGLSVSLTRASWLGAVGGILVVVAGSRQSRLVLTIIAAMGLSIAAVVVVSLFGAALLESRATSTSELYSRVIVQRAALSIIADHPLIGVGSGRFASLAGGDLRNVGAISGSFGVGILVPHNSVLSASVDGGLGAGASLVVVLGLLSVAAKRLWSVPTQRYLGIAALGCIVVFVTNAMFIDMSLGGSLATLALTIIGILLSSPGRQGRGSS